MIGRSPHLDERALLDAYLAERGGAPAPTAAAKHLEACTECSARYGQVEAFMDDVRADADAEIDEQFSTEDLQTARRQIARRIENLGHIARVIAFPGRRPSVDVRRGLPMRATRWIAGAAAAGLLVGMVLGAYTNRVSRLEADNAPASAPVSIATDRVLAPAAPEPGLPPVSTLDEDAFLREVELASVGLRTAALAPFDAFTPTVREVSAQLR